MGQAKRRKLFDQALISDENHDSDKSPAAVLKHELFSISRSVRDKASEKKEPQYQLELLRLENEQLRISLNTLEQQLMATEAERDVTTRLLQQQTRRISEMQRQLAHRAMQVQLVQKAFYSATWRIALRATKVMLTRMLPSKQ